MELKYLLPHKFKLIGGILLLAGIILLILMYYGGFEAEWLTGRVPELQSHIISGDEGEKTISEFIWNENNLTAELGIVLALVGALLLGFSKERQEDEFIYKLRLESLFWALIINTVIFIVATITVYGPNFLTIMAYNMFTPLLIYILRFNFLLIKARAHEE